MNAYVCELQQDKVELFLVAQSEDEPALAELWQLAVALGSLRIPYSIGRDPGEDNHDVLRIPLTRTRES